MNLPTQKKHNKSNIEPTHRNGEINIQDQQSSLWSPPWILESGRDESYGVPVMGKLRKHPPGFLPCGEIQIAGVSLCGPELRFKRI